METLNLYMQLDKTHPQIVDGLLAECGDDLAAKVIALRNAKKFEAFAAAHDAINNAVDIAFGKRRVDIISDQKRIDLLVDQLAKVEAERDALIHNAATKKPLGYLIQFDGGTSPVEYLPMDRAHMLSEMENVHVQPVFAW